MGESDRQKTESTFRAILPYGLLLGLTLAAIKLTEYSFFARDIGLEVYLGVVAVVFLLVGLFAGPKIFGRSSGSSTESLPDFSRPRTEPQTPPGGELSDREMEVLLRLAEGETNKEIGEALFVSPNTIKSHVTNIYRKLDVSRRPQAVTRARELGILE